MHFTKAALTLGAITRLATAHTLATTLFVNGVDQGDAVGIRMPTSPDSATDPVEDLSSNNMACGFDGEKGVARVISIPQSAKLTFEFRLWPDASQPGSIDVSHKGPCAVYMKKVDNAVTDVGYGAGWFKIWDDGYDSTTSKWCTEKLIDTNGLLSVVVPSDLASGPYLVRSELLALQSANIDDPQFYIGCAQVFLTSTGTSLPTDTVSIPGYVSAGTPMVDFNIYQPTWPYVVPGPVPYKSTAVARLVKDDVSVQTVGLKPANCVLENCNWCGIELASYTTETGCWNASAECWDQATACYAQSGPTGSTNCKIWETKCNTIQTACGAGDYSGPPNKGVILTPTLPKISVPAPAATVYTGIAGVATSVPSVVPAKAITIAAVTAPATAPKSVAVTSSTLNISTDGSCGSSTCQGSTFGNCCSQHNWCGSSTEYCGSGCQSEFGTCGASSSRRSHMLRHKMARALNDDQSRA